MTNRDLIKAIRAHASRPVMSEREILASDSDSELLPETEPFRFRTVRRGKVVLESDGTILATILGSDANGYCTYAGEHGALIGRIQDSPCTWNQAVWSAMYVALYDTPYRLPIGGESAQ